MKYPAVLYPAVLYPAVVVYPAVLYPAAICLWRINFTFSRPAGPHQLISRPYIYMYISA